MKKDVLQYLEEKYSKASFNIVPGHFPDFKSKEEIDEWFEVLERDIPALIEIGRSRRKK